MNPNIVHSIDASLANRARLAMSAHYGNNNVHVQTTQKVPEEPKSRQVLRAEERALRKRFSRVMRMAGVDK